MREVYAVAESGQKGSATRPESKTQTRIIAAALLSIFFLSLVLLLKYAENYREDRYVVGAGVMYPGWPAIALPFFDFEYELYVDWCRGAEPSDIFCALISKSRTNRRFANELTIIRQATATDRSTSYCDDFFGPCRTQPANITFDDARAIFKYLDSVYLRKARVDTIRGRLSLAKDSIARIGYLLGRVDLPLGSENCCHRWDMHYIAPAFLSDKKFWRSREYVNTVFSLTESSWEERSHGNSIALNDTDTYATGIKSTKIGCYRIAGRAFESLAVSDGRNSLRELAAYMALLSRFRESASEGKSQECIYPQPSSISETEAAALRKLVKRVGLVSDIEQMDVAIAERRANATTK